MMDRHLFILDDANNPIPAKTLTWAKWFERFSNRRVAYTKVGPYDVSTIFDGINYRFGHPGDPLVFETMVFDNRKEKGRDVARKRYCTWKEAEEGHQRAVEKYEILTGEVGVPMVDECEATPEQPS